MAVHTVCDICKKIIETHWYTHEQVTHIHLEINASEEKDVCSVHCLEQLVHNLRRNSEKE